MAFMYNRRDYGVRRIEWFELFGRVGVTAAGYPFEYVKILIQIGHEPIPPKPGRTLLGKPALILPGVFTYMKYVRKIDGFTGLYRGLLPKLCTNLFNGITYTMVLEHLPSFNGEDELTDEQKEELSEEQKLTQFVHKLIRESIARCAAIVASFPFHIITIRTIAQFVGREEKYGGIFVSLREIYSQDGIGGFFSGLIPRLCGEIFTLWVASIASFFINNYVIEEKALKGYVKASMVYIASALFYPFAVVSNVVIVNNCGLAAGVPPNMPIYTSWTDCWSHLSAIGQLKRGSSIIWRYYKGPYMTSEAYGFGRSPSKKFY